MPDRPSSPAAAFSRRLAALMAERRLSAFQLAEDSGVTRQTICNILAGSEPRWGTVCRLADALGVGVGAFRGEG